MSKKSFLKIEEPITTINLYSHFIHFLHTYIWNKKINEDKYFLKSVIKTVE